LFGGAAEERFLDLPRKSFLEQKFYLLVQ
jgi:hypothetical protein